jgi:signal transduction histidine kinase
MRPSARNDVDHILPPRGDGFNIQDTLSWYIAAFQERTGIQCESRCELRERIAESIQAAALFQILEEILVNIARHADATKVYVSLGDHADIMILRVADNGRGFREDSVGSKSSRGIVGMREYARLCGGEFRINSSPARGTTVIVSIPVRRR